MELAEFFHGIVEEKRGNLGKDIISILIQAEEEGMKLSVEELVPFCNLLLVAGNETTTNLLSNAVFSIMETPGAYEELSTLTCFIFRNHYSVLQKGPSILLYLRYCT
ncbi:cytochrome P450 [Bacillus sp. V59.32b]|nr:cytochrome P450 [Bacillus sp. V59.32b]